MRIIHLLPNQLAQIVYRAKGKRQTSKGIALRFITASLCSGFPEAMFVRAREASLWSEININLISKNHLFYLISSNLSTRCVCVLFSTVVHSSFIYGCSQRQKFKISDKYFKLLMLQVKMEKLLRLTRQSRDYGLMRFFHFCRDGKIYL